MKYKRIMGLDYGSKTVGVAISDELLMTAQPKETIFREKETKLRKTLARIAELVEKYEVDLIVLGLPINMDATHGERVEKSILFRDVLKKRLDALFEREIDVKFVDERLTTREADEILAMSKVPKSERKEYVDKIAASLILKDYMENRREITI